MKSQAPIYEVYYSGPDQDTLVMRADLDRGWHELKNRWGFSDSLLVGFRQDWSIRAQLQVTAHGLLAKNAPEFPGRTCECIGDLLSYTLKERRLEVRVPLVLQQPWRKMSNGRPGLQFQGLAFVRLHSYLHFSFGGLIVFHEPFPAPIADVREWGQKMFLPGGRPESNRRRF
jgi:hypothetical protein